MKHLTLSIEDVKRDLKRLEKYIESNGFQPSCIVYIKNGGYLVGKEMGNYFKVPVNGIKISRRGNGLKTKIKFLFRIIPSFLKNFLRELEIKLQVHKIHNKRVVTQIDGNLVQGLNVLLVDDSIDTGNSIVSAIRFIKENYGESLKIQVAALNKFNMSDEKVTTNYYIYKDTIITYPWSKDSREYKKFINMYTRNI
ncbi:phosphoribosyltransferase [Hathewaya histolytica]|nr:phosphoribosyltransferase [Hathewaya histolytica]